MRSSSVRGLNRVRSYVEIKDEIGARKVRFSDPEHDCLPNVRPNASPVQHKPSRDLAWISTMFKNSCDNITPLLVVEKARPTTHTLFLSPDVNASNNLEAANTVDENMHKDIGSPSFPEKVKPINCSLFLSPIGGALKNSGNGYLVEEVFSGKREKFHQWVAKTSLSEIEELCSEGDAKPMQMQPDTKYSSYAAPESYIYDEEYHWSDRKDLLKAEHGCYLKDFCDRPRERIPSKWDTKVSNSPSTSYASNNRFQYENKEFGLIINVDLQV
ncbi:Glucose-1-phosphate thymidylyltransferase [Actinidia chinensis var. chinensis]|uniref:Glucose-1-phosphate thymidylyltransferase n=1 Tax=Actinidia chinensis var. chinensis TaxID=1590841 RepID=A0A2R6PEI8_ACTCC|nr:Glucose-1-phosphate thymidylyltransferase [Actinidia chinensis var. chinensis]